MRTIQLLSFLTFFLLATSNPIQPGTFPDDVFFRSLNPTERSALTETVVDVAGQIAAQRSSGTFTARVNFVIPDVIIQRIRETTDVKFETELVRWIGRRWNLSDRAITELQSKGRGCNPRICLSITSRSSDTCCPFG